MGKDFLYKSIKYLYSLSLYKRRILIVLSDFSCIFISFYFSIFLTYYEASETIQRINLYSTYFWIACLSIFICLPIYYFTGLYKSISKYFNSTLFYNQIQRNIFSILILFIVGKLCNFETPTLNFFIIFNISLTLSSLITRLFLRDLIIYRKSLNIDKIAIFGADEIGANLALAVQNSKLYKVAFFVDQDSSLWGRNLYGIPILSPNKLKSRRSEIVSVLISNSYINRETQKEIIDLIRSLSLGILEVPSLNQVAAGKVKISNLRPVNIDELLGRDPKLINYDLLGSNIKDSVVCVTGGGGSIGSELCRQILKLNPKKLIIIDNNEPSLYFIEEEFKNISTEKSEVFTLLGNAQDQKFLEKIFTKNHVDIIFHAAAYKHVPIVENNPIVGISNNILSTISVCKAAKKASVSQMVLISSDKAVRPTNIMGATKRLAEIIVQKFDEEEKILYLKNKQKIKFSIVRFGNVLDSSGSVLPLFKKQIESGGPITLTHPKVNRYFMTIPEAALLVIQTIDINDGGDIFLLDMGAPVLIKDLAIKLINISGLTLKNKDNPNGDIEIKYIGLRKGEKLFEELLIDGKSIPTNHPLIFKANDRSINLTTLWEDINLLISFLQFQNEEKALETLKKLVPDWTRYIN